MKRYMRMHKMMLATCKQKELDWIVAAYKGYTNYALLHSDFSAFVATGLTAEILERELNMDDLEVSAFVRFLRELDDAGIDGVFLKVQLSEGEHYLRSTDEEVKK